MYLFIPHTSEVAHDLTLSITHRLPPPPPVGGIDGLVATASSNPVGKIRAPGLLLFPPPQPERARIKIKKYLFFSLSSL